MQFIDEEYGASAVGGEVVSGGELTQRAPLQMEGGRPRPPRGSRRLAGTLALQDKARHVSRQEGLGLGH